MLDFAEVIGSVVAFVGVFVSCFGSVDGGGCVGVLCSDDGGCACCVGVFAGVCDGVFGCACACVGSFTEPEVMGISVSLEQQRPILLISSSSSSLALYIYIYISSSTLEFLCMDQWTIVLHSTAFSS